MAIGGEVLAKGAVGRSFDGMQVTAIYPLHLGNPMVLPLADSSVPAGFASPALDHAEPPLDLTSYLVRHPAATHLVRAKGDSMEKAGILDGALLVVDRSAEVRDGRIVIAVVDGGFTVKHLAISDGQARLIAANKRYKDIPLTGEDTVWGVVIHAINSFK